MSHAILVVKRSMNRYMWLQSIITKYSSNVILFYSWLGDKTDIVIKSYIRVSEPIIISDLMLAIEVYIPIYEQYLYNAG